MKNSVIFKHTFTNNICETLFTRSQEQNKSMNGDLFRGSALHISRPERKIILNDISQTLASDSKVEDIIDLRRDRIALRYKKCSTFMTTNTFEYKMKIFLKNVRDTADRVRFKGR